MKIRTIILALTGLCLLSLPTYSQTENPAAAAGPMTLTVKAVRVGRPCPDIGGELALITTDEKGNTITFDYREGRFFENAAGPRCLRPDDIKVVPDLAGGNIILTLSEGRLVLEFDVGDKTYKFSVGTGSQLVVKKTAEGKYILMPEETAKLSPPPAEKK